MKEKNEIDIFEDIKCVVCQNNKKDMFTVKYRKHDCVIMACQKCTFHFIPPFYRRKVDYSNYKSTEVAAEIKKSNVWIKIQRNLLRYQLIAKYQDKKRIFDVGAGYGHFLLTGRQLGYEIAGIEMSRANVAYMRNELKLPVEEADFLTYKTETKYDILTMWDVLEHINKADLVIEKAANTLEKGGFMFIQVPQWDGFFARLLKDRWWSMGLDHVNYFTKKTITQLLSAYGFKVRTIKSSIELKNILNNFIIPRFIKRKISAEKKWTATERQKQFNKLTNKPKWQLYIFVKIHNIIYKILSRLHIGNEMVVVVEKL